MPQLVSEKSPSDKVEMALGGLFLLWIFLTTLGPTVEFDVWFRLRYGEETLAHWQVPRYLHFLWPQPSLPPHFTPGNDWLFSLLTYIVYRIGGLALLPWAKSLLVSVLFGLQWNNLKRVGLAPAWRLALLFLAFKVFESRLMLRPQLCTDIFLALLVNFYLGEQRGEDEVPRLTVKVAALFALWSNIHLGVAAGFAFLGILFSEKDLRQRKFPKRACLLVLAALGGSCLRPSGPYFLFSIAEHMQAGADHPLNMEWQPMAASALQGYFGVYLLLTLLTWGLALKQRSPHILTFSTVAGLAWFMAWRQVRAVGELSALTPAFLAQSLAALPKQPKIALIGALALALGIATDLRRPDLLRAVPPQFYPDRAADYIEKNDAASGVFCSYHLGGYLTFRHLLPYIHGMTQFFPAQRFTDYLARLRSPQIGEELLQDGVGWVVLGYSPENDAHTVAARRLAGLEGPSQWGLVYFDAACMLFRPHPRESFRAIMPALTNPIVGSPEEATEEVRRATLLAGADDALVLQLQAQLADSRGEDSMPRWDEVVRRYPQRATARLTRGRLLFKRGQLEASQTDLETYLALVPDSAIGRYNLALVLLQRAQKQNRQDLVTVARQKLQEAAALDPTFQPAQELLRKL